MKRSIRARGSNEVPIKIVTDSNCDLPADLVARYGVTVVPLYINIGKKSYLDGVEITHAQFYEGLPHFESHPTTSVPSPGQLVQVYEHLAHDGFDFFGFEKLKPGLRIFDIQPEQDQ